MEKKNIDMVGCYKLLEECISFEHIEDKEFICKNLNMVNDYKNAISDEAYSDIQKFIKDVIHPILFDADYFSFLNRPEFGSIDEQGHFVINSEESLEMMIFLMYGHTLELNEKLLQMIFKYI